MTRMLAVKDLSYEKALTKTIFWPDVRYVWVDEDDHPVRADPFRDFGGALTFFQTWSDRKRRIQTSLEMERSRRNPTTWIIERKEKELNALSLTGKPPVKLFKLVIQATVQELDSSEDEIISALQHRN